jgi:hypothetical protein
MTERQNLYPLGEIMGLEMGLRNGILVVTITILEACDRSKVNERNRQNHFPSPGSQYTSLQLQPYLTEL